MRGLERSVLSALKHLPNTPKTSLKHLPDTSKTSVVLRGIPPYESWFRKICLGRIVFSGAGLRANVQRPPGARRRRAAGAHADTASVAIGRQSSRATKKKLPRRRTFCRTKPAPKTPPRDQTGIARGSGHPSEANDSILGALRARQSPLAVGGLKRSKKRLFLRRDAPRGSVLPPRRTDQWVVAPRANDQVHLYHPDSSNTFSSAPITI